MGIGRLEERASDGRLRRWQLDLGVQIADSLSKLWVKSVREKVGESLDPPHLVSQASFAELVGVDVSTVHRWETGQTTPDFASVMSMLALELRYIAERRYTLEEIRSVTLLGYFLRHSIIAQTQDDALVLVKMLTMASFTSAVDVVEMLDALDAYRGPVPESPESQPHYVPREPQEPVATPNPADLTEVTCFNCEHIIENVSVGAPTIECPTCGEENVLTWETGSSPE